MKKIIFALCALLAASSAWASPISIYTAPDMTYANTTNNPCVFHGPGGSGCNQNPAGWVTVGDTGGGDPFNPYPLVNNYGDALGELALFGANVGRDFLIGLDINDTSEAQTLDNLTINFLNAANVNIGSYTFAPPTLVASNANGIGWADYVLSAGCGGVVGGGAGVLATCSAYTPFVAPAGTRHINFTFGLTGFNDGPDKLFLISAGAGGVPTPFDEDPPTTVPEPASMLTVATGIAAIAAKRRRLKKKEAAE